MKGMGEIAMQFVTRPSMVRMHCTSITPLTRASLAYRVY
jgi:hypothetical protein